MLDILLVDRPPRCRYKTRNFDSVPLYQFTSPSPLNSLSTPYPTLITLHTMAEKASRWDTPATGGAPSGPTPNATAAAQAAAIAAKIAASLRPGVAGNELIKKSEDEGFVRDIEINDLRNRYVLTKGPTQKQVSHSRGR
jgi:hypothetical protein